MAVRSVAEIIESFRQGLKSAGSNLANFTDYSNIYILYRSIASVISRQDAELNKAKQALFISTASGKDLDDIAYEYGIVRKKGSSATGYVLISNPGSHKIKIPRGIILTNAANLIQFETLQEFNTNSVGETSISIKSLNNSIDSNLPAGTRLYSNLFPNVDFIVGKFRNSLTKNVEGSLTNGTNLESDLDLRNRISNYLNTRSKATKSSLLSEIINAPLPITKVLIKEHTPITGYFTVYVDTQDISVLRQIEYIVENNKAAGVCGIVKPLIILPTIISLEVYIKSSQDSDSIISSVKQNVTDYLNSLQPGQTLYRESLAGSVIKIPEVLNCRILKPTNNILVKQEQTVSIESIQVNLILGDRGDQ